MLTPTGLRILIGISSAILAGSFVLVFLLVRSFRSLKNAEKHYRHVMDTISDLVYEANSSDQIVFWNKAFSRIFRFAESKDLNGTSILDLYVNQAHRQILKEEMEDREGILMDYVVWVRRQTGEDLYLSINSESLPANGTSVVRGTGRDVTQRIEMIGGFCQLNKQGRITFCDKLFSKSFGFSSPNLLIGHKVTEALDIPTVEWDRARRLLSKRLHMESAFAITNNGGGLSYATFGIHKVADSRGKFQTIELSLKESRSGGLYILQDERFVYTDTEFDKIAGYPDQSIVGCRIQDVVFAEDLPLVIRELDRKLGGGYSRVYEFRIHQRNGDTKRVISDSVPTEYRGRPALAGYLADVSEVSVVRERLQRRQRLVEMGRSVDNMRHYFGNLIAPLVGRAESLDKSVRQLEIPENMRQQMLISLRWMKASSRQLTNAFNKLYAPRTTKANQKPSTLRSLLRSVTGSLRIPPIIRVRIDLQPELPLVRRGNSELLSAFTYIVSNAVEAMPDGGDLTISAIYDEHRDSLVLRFQDTGTGITEEDLPRVTRPFFSTKASTEKSGSGLGLWYCSQVFDELHASMLIESETEPPDNGTLIEIVFERFKKEVSGVS